MLFEQAIGGNVLFPKVWLSLCCCICER